MSPDNGIEPGLVDELLSLPTRGEQTGLLRENDLLDADGLDLLLNTADRLLDNDPDSARRLARLCIAFAGDTEASAAIPRAQYVLAGAHGINGEFEDDLRLTRAAHDGYVALGMTLEALRTKVGLMPALLELGRYEEALAAGQIVLDALDGAGGAGVAPTSQESELLVAFVHQNRGACYELVGRYEAALEAYDSAKDRYQVLGMIERLGQVEDNRGIVLSYLGRGREALRAHETAADIFEEAGLSLSLAKALANVGETYLQLADFVRSLGAFEKSRRLLQDLDATAEECALLHNTASAYLNLALYQEALATYRDANDLLRKTNMVHDRARTLQGMGSALMALSGLEEAEEALDEAATLFEEANNAPLLSSVLLEQASLRVARGNDEGALSAARRALDLVSAGDRPIHLIYAHLSLADLLPDAVEAEAHLLEAQRLTGPLGLPQLSYRLNERLGHLRLAQGRRDEAKALLEAAVGEIERLRGTVTQETMRISFLQNKSAAYAGLLQLHLTHRDGAETRQAFAISERAKSRALVDLITGVAEVGVASTENPEVEERLRNLQADLNTTYGRMLGGVEQGVGSSLQDLQKRANQLETSVGRLRLQAAASSDPFAAPAATLENVLERHSFDGTLLAYHAIGDEILAFVVSGDDVRAARNVGSVSAVQELTHKLALQWNRFLAGSTFTGRHMAMLERSTRQVLAALYKELMMPLEPLLRHSTSDARAAGGVPELIVVPYGHLHRVPFHALYDGEGYVLETFEVSYAPSATVYALCQEKRMSELGGAAIFGVEDPSIPAAAAEARAVAKHLSGARIRVGEGATVEALRREASANGVLHLACHGLFRAGNPMFSSLKLHDGWLTAADALSLDLPGSLVTLSACESGRSDVTTGGDEVLGLTRAFLGAGAATLVVSLWLAQDESTAALMEDWYRRMGDGMGRATALRAAQLKMKDRHPHPYYWAPFVLIGKR